ncbi:M14 family metallopeptidase [Lacibacterium aquatile]|uniref:M14 family metallopeptidase n=1 Tax=Lacibacterium aquatile TaxID=1168082 RepID=A0ABW5DRU7_9PROT
MTHSIPIVELTLPDLRPYAEGNCGVPYVWRFESGQPGPDAMLVALTHGNELCGAIALDKLLRAGMRPKRGALTFVFANIAAALNFDPLMPEQSRYVDEDFNRVWDIATLDGPRTSTELIRARALRPIVDRADLLLDLHSMQHPTEPLALAGMQQKGREMAERIGLPATIVMDKGHTSGRRLRDYGFFDDPASSKAALLVECGQHWETSSAQVAEATVARFLAAYDIADPGPVPPPTPQRTIEVTEAITVSTDRFHFVAPYLGMEIIEQAGSIIAYDGASPIYTPYDNCVLIMPTRNLRPGLTAVRLGRLSQ